MEVCGQAWEKEYMKQFAAAEVPRMRPLKTKPMPPPELSLTAVGGGDEAVMQRHAALEKKERDRQARPFLCENDRVPGEILQEFKEEIKYNRQVSEWKHQMELREPKGHSKLLNLTRNLRSAWSAPFSSLPPVLRLASLHVTARVVLSGWRSCSAQSLPSPCPTSPPSTPILPLPLRPSTLCGGR